MIDVALTLIRDLLNQHFKNRFSISENKAILSNLVEGDGSFPREVEDKIVFFLLKIDEESSLKNRGSHSSEMSSSQYQVKAPPLFLNLHVIFCANFRNQNYIEGLNYLSSVISFFQQNKFIVPTISNGLSKRVEKLSFELCKTDFDQLSHIWSSVGSKLLPTVLYKISMVVFDDTPIRKITPAITSNQKEGI